MKNRRKRSRWLIPTLLCLLTLITGTTAYAAQEPVNVSLPVRQEFHTENAPKVLDDTFVYSLTAKDGAPLPNGADSVYTFTLTGNEKTMLDGFTYTHGDVYEYTLSQSIEEKKTGYTYDTQIYDIYVYVKNESDTALSAQIVAVTRAGQKTDDVVFSNSYKGTMSAGSGQPVQTGKPDNGTGKGKSGGVQTGDDTTVSAWILAVLLSGVLIFWIIRRNMSPKTDDGSGIQQGGNDM